MRRTKRHEQVQGFRPLRVRVPFGWTQKEPKGPFAGRDPPRYSRGGSLRFSVDGAHWDLHGSAAQTRCAQTWAALRPRRPAMLGSLYGSIEITGAKPEPEQGLKQKAESKEQRAKSKAKLQKPEPKITAKRSGSRRRQQAILRSARCCPMAADAHRWRKAELTPPRQRRN